MNVQQLIEELQKFPPEAEVITEGCDCFGKTVEVGYDTSYPLPSGKRFNPRVVVIAREAGWVRRKETPPL